VRVGGMGARRRSAVSFGPVLGGPRLRCVGSRKHESPRDFGRDTRLPGRHVGGGVLVPMSRDFRRVNLSATFSLLAITWTAVFGFDAVRYPVDNANVEVRKVLSSKEKVRHSSCRLGDNRDRGA
jgi:hypothetical protein